MADYTNHADILAMLSDAQSADEDIRETARECHHFIDKEDGQWDPGIIEQMDDRPRFTFDHVSGLVDDIAGELSSSEFSIKIRPSGGDASDDIAKTYDGLIRNIQNISNATNVYDAAAKNMITCGMDGWRVTTDWVQSDSFDQDLLITPISNYLDRVWFDAGSELQDKSDANWCIVLQAMTPAAYADRFPEGSKMSVSDNRQETVYSDKAEFITVGEILYKKKVSTKLFKMSNEAVYTEEDLEPIKNELEDAGVTVTRERTKKIDHVHSRFFDGSGWLEPEKETVFEWLPVVPIYANFKITENKTIWRGEVQKKMDAQRVYNYAKSREIEEGALAPRGKYWMSEEQAIGHEDTLETMNTNADAVQFYNPQADQPPPFWQGGAQVNQGLQVTAADARQDIKTGSGQVDPNMGGGMFQSGEATRLLQNKADTGNIKYSKAVAVGICHTARILMNAAPKVYDAKRQVRVAGEDGSFEMVILNEQIFDQDSGEMVSINDLNQGVYDATCDVGPAFKNRKQETIDQMLKLAAVAPEVMGMGLDVFLSSSDAPKINVLAERVRAGMVKSGAIPEDQLTEAEKEQLQAAQQAASQQPAEPTPEEKIGQAELQKAQADVADTQSIIEDRNKRFELDVEKTKIDAEDSDQKLQLDMQKIQLENRKLDQAENMNNLKANQQQFTQQQSQIDLLMKELKNNADVLKTLKDAMGVDAIVGPATTEAYAQQAEMVTESQEQINPNIEIESYSQNLLDNGVS